VRCNKAEGGRFEPGAGDHSGSAANIEGADASTIPRAKSVKRAKPQTALNDPEEPG